jgi:glycosyltransferase involved in cell wall biosynthesis
MIKFGIVIPTYKRSDGLTIKFLNRCLESIKNQTYTNYKVFLIGDRYEDAIEFDGFGKNLFNENELYKENLKFAKERDKYTNKRILWLYGGIYASNYGIDLAINEGINYICRLDHDDYWGPNHLKNFNDCILENDAQFVCSMSTHINNTTLPRVGKTNEKYISYLPQPSGCVISSTCLNQQKIPLRSKNLFEETGVIGQPGDADLWNRVSKYIVDKKYKSFLINETTCFHDEEGYSLR